MLGECDEVDPGTLHASFRRPSPAFSLQNLRYALVGLMFRTHAPEWQGRCDRRVGRGTDADADHAATTRSLASKTQISQSYKGGAFRERDCIILGWRAGANAAG